MYDHLRTDSRFILRRLAKIYNLNIESKTQFSHRNVFEINRFGCDVSPLSVMLRKCIKSKKSKQHGRYSRCACLFIQIYCVYCNIFFHLLKHHDKFRKLITS